MKVVRLALIMTCGSWALRRGDIRMAVECTGARKRMLRIGRVTISRRMRQYLGDGAADLAGTLLCIPRPTDLH